MADAESPPTDVGQYLKEKLSISGDYYKGMLNGTYPDTGRAASSPGERMDSLFGGPSRAAIASMQQGDFAGAPAAAWNKFNTDPQINPAPSGEDLMRNAGVTNKYAAKGLGVLADVATDPVTLASMGAGKLPGMTGEIVDASKMFGKKNPPGARQALTKAMAIERGEIAAVGPAEGSIEADLTNRYGDNPAALTAIDKMRGTDIPYGTKANHGQDVPIPIGNFDYKPDGIIGAPMIQHNTSTTTDSMDPLSWMDSKYKIVKDAMEKSPTPLTVNTSSDLIGREDYIKALPDKSKVNMYMLTENPDLNRKLFPGNPSQGRLESAAQKLKEAGVNVNKIYPTPDQVIDRANAYNVVGSSDDAKASLEFGNVDDSAPTIIERQTGMTPDALKDFLSQPGNLKRNPPNLTAVKAQMGAISPSIPRSPQSNDEPPMDVQKYLSEKNGTSPQDQEQSSTLNDKLQNVNDQINAFGDSAANAALLGYVPQIKAKLGQVMSGEGTANDANYVNRRDQAIADMKANSDKYPIPNAAGTAAGFIAPMVASGGASAAEEVPYAIARAMAKGTAIGAGIGAAQNPGDETGVVDPIQAGARGKNAGIGALAGGVMTGAAGMIPETAEPINNYAEKKAFKSSGAVLKDYRKGYANNNIQETGRFMLDNGLVEAGDSFDDVASKASALRDKIGQQLKNGYDAASKVIQKVNPEAAEKIDDAGFNPVRDKAEILAAAKDDLGYSYNRKSALSGLSNYLDELAEEHGDQTLNPGITNQIKTGLDKSAINWERNPLSREPDAESALKTLRGILNDKVKGQIQTIGEAIGDPDASGSLASLNEKYGMSSKVSRFAGDRANREAANQSFGLGEKITGGTGALIGAEIGHQLAGVPGALAGGVIGGTGGAVTNKIARKFGNQAVASAADTVGKTLSNIPELSAIQQSNPALYEALASKLQPSGKAPMTAAKNELDKDSSTPAMQQLKGEAKWAADGFNNLVQHAGSPNGLDRGALMANPKTKDLLIQAQGLKPGSKQLDKILEKIKATGKDK